MAAVVQSLGAMVFLSDYLGVDGLLDTLSYTNAVTLARIACTSRMGYVAAHEAQQRPALCVVKGNLDTVKSELREQLAAKPTVVFVQYSLGHGEDEDEFEAELAKFMAQKLPSSTQVLGGSTMSLQCAWFPKNAASSQGVARQTTLDCRNRFERSEVALLAATLPEAKARVYHVMPKGAAARGNSSESEEEYSYSDMEDEDEENLLPDENQAKGGYGQATKGGPPAAKTSSEDQLNELLNLDPAPKVVVVYDADRGSSTARVISKIQEAYPEAAIVGGVVMGRRVVAKRGQGGDTSNGRGVGALAISGNAPLFAMTCPFTGCVKTAEQTVATCMKSAEAMAAERCQSILGALLFTCNARGSHMFGRDAKDAALFKAQFPRAPLMGFYAAGEIGPQVEDGAEHAFLRGNACLQGFTAVFGLFLVPSKHMPSAAFQRAMLHGEVQEAFADTR